MNGAGAARMAWAMLRDRPGAVAFAGCVAVLGVAIVVVGAVTVAAWAVAGAGGDPGGRLAAFVLGAVAVRVGRRRRSAENSSGV